MTDVIVVFDTTTQVVEVQVPGPQGPAGPPLVRTLVSSATDVTAAVGPGDFVYELTVPGSTLTLPSAVGRSSMYTLKNGSSGTVHAASTGGQTFDGTASPIDSRRPGESLSFLPVAGNWRLV